MHHASCVAAFALIGGVSSLVLMGMWRRLPSLQGCKFMHADRWACLLRSNQLAQHATLCSSNNADVIFLSDSTRFLLIEPSPSARSGQPRSHFLSPLYDAHALAGHTVPARGRTVPTVRVSSVRLEPPSHADAGAEEAAGCDPNDSGAPEAAR
jgi:hypothetical protein